MEIPIGTDVRMRHLPFANVGIIVLAVLVYMGIGPAWDSPDNPYVLSGWTVTGIVGHIWMHADPWHLAGNMLFLWVFGNTVCGRVGNFWYPLIYIGLGIVTAVTAMPLPGSRAVGASAAINGIVGMFLVLFPHSRVKFLWSAPGITGGVVMMPSFYVVAGWFVNDMAGLLFRSDGIGHGAHVAGLLAGIGLAAILLAFNAVPVYPREKTLLHRLGWSLPVTPEPELPGLAPLPPEKDKEFYNIPPLLQDLDGPEVGLPEGDPPPPLPPTPPPVKDRPSRFEFWRRAPGAVHLRCVCGKSLTYVRTRTPGVIECPTCGAQIDVPAR
jgi:membrane associated rhomboid family serine protease